MRAISSFSLEWGTSTFCCRALMALRTRVRKSETGSVKLMLCFSFNRRPFACLCTGKNPQRRTYHFASYQSLVTSFSQLPARLRNSRYLAAQRQVAKMQPAQAKLAQVTARASADLAAVMLPGRELGLLVRLRYM